MLAWMGEKITQLEADACIFMAREGDALLLVAIYVDDASCIYRAEGEGSLYGRFYRDFHASWEAIDNGELQDMLNVQYEYGDEVIKLHQQSYIESLCKDFFAKGMPDLRAGQTPHANNLPQLVLNSISSAQPSVAPEQHKRF